MQNQDKEFAKRIREIRIAKGLSIKEVATKIGVAATTYREWEYGRSVTGLRYLQLAHVFEISTYQLLGIEHSDTQEVMEKLQRIEDIVSELKKRF